jgi:hypothetical protein
MAVDRIPSGRVGWRVCWCARLCAHPRGSVQEDVRFCFSVTSRCTRRYHTWSKSCPKRQRSRSPNARARLMSCASKRCQVRSCACTRAPTTYVCGARDSHTARTSHANSSSMWGSRAHSHTHMHTQALHARTHKHTRTHANTHARTLALSHARVRAHTVFYNVRDGPYYPTLRIAHQYPFCMPTMRVDSGAIKFVLSGYVLVREHVLYGENTFFIESRHSLCRPCALTSAP